MAEQNKLTDLLYFNGVDGLTGDYFMPPMTITELAGVIGGEQDPVRLQELNKVAQAGSFRVRSGINPKELAETGWGIIFAQADAKVGEVKRALQDLIEWRRQQATAGNPQLFQIFEGPRGYRQGETAPQFLNRFRVGEGSVDPHKGIPYYLLIVGSPELIPYEFQFQLDVDFAVGRLYFDTPQEYSRYAQSIVAAEGGQVKRPRRVSLFGVSNPNDLATQSSAQHLINPLAAVLQQPKYTGAGWHLDQFVGAGQASKTQLQCLLGGDQTPALLLTASHGLAFTPGSVDQSIHEAQQGAIVCQDWPGPGSALSRDFYLAGEDIADSQRPAGLIAFFFACFGAGTPQQNDFLEIDTYLAQKAGRPALAPYMATRPFVSQLPRRLLGHPNGGALAVIGHVERAWTQSFMLSDFSAPNITNFDIVLDLLLAGNPVGEAMDEFGNRFATIATRLTAQMKDFESYRRDRENYPDYYDQYLVAHGQELVSLWTRHHDARNYIILGDPAVRLQVAEPDETPTEQPVVEIKPVPEAPPQTPPPSPASANLSLNHELALALWGSSPKTEAESGPGPLKQFVDKLGQFMIQVLDDTTTLEVDTYVSQDLDQVEYKGGKFVGARLRAATRITLDGDTRLCVPQDEEGNLETELWAIHIEAVRQAQASRAELVKTAIEAGTALFNLFKPG